MNDSLLLVTHVAIRKGTNGLQIDDQTAAGIVQWCKHFDKVSYYGIEEGSKSAPSSSITWVDLAAFKGAEKCELFVLPNAYRLVDMLKEYRSVCEALDNAVKSHQHLCFTIGGLIGDWPAIAASRAIRQRKKFSAWIDRVEPLIIRNKLTQGASLLKRSAAAVLLPTMEAYTQYLLRNSAVALLQGRDTFDHYSRFASAPYCTYDTHTTVEDQIKPALIAEKVTRIASGEPLRILYVGRADAMKGPMDWINVLEGLENLRVPFEATWIGDGEALTKMREMVEKLGLTAKIHLPGFDGDRHRLLSTMRESDIFLYCHKTPESPRSLVEALVCGCPIVGYETSYPKGLVEASGGGLFAARNDVKELTRKVQALHHNRSMLSTLIRAAASSGEIYNEDAVYARRANLMPNARTHE